MFNILFVIGFPIVLAMALIYALVAHKKMVSAMQEVIDAQKDEIETLQHVGEMLSRQVQKRDTLNSHLASQLESTDDDLRAALDNLKMVLEGPLWTPNINFENYEPEWLSDQTQSLPDDFTAEDFADEGDHSFFDTNYESILDEIYNPDNTIKKD